jgi:hypothetical protein
MSLATRILRRILQSLQEKTAAWILSGLGVVAGIVWVWVWTRFDPNFDYQAQPSGTSAQFVFLSQILSQIEKDSHVYCGQDWSSRVAWVGLRTCYNLSFNPPSTYRMAICTHDQRTLRVRTPDQLQAVRYFENRFPSLECLKIVQRSDKNSYSVVPGKNTKFRMLKFPNDLPQETGFCGCSDDEVEEIAKASGATLP